MLIRNATAGDVPVLGGLITEAFRLLPQASGTEAGIVDRLRAAQALTLSLVAADGADVTGYLAASPARAGTQEGWVILGPIAVTPSRMRQGIGTALITEALRRLRADFHGVAVVGDPAYYGRFGFCPFPGFGVTGCPAEFVLALPFGDISPHGELIMHPAFGVRPSG